MIDKKYSIDILVPTYNRGEELKKFFFEIKKQTFKNYKIIIIDDCSSIPINQFIPNDDRIIYRRLDKNKGQAFARNIGLELCTSDIVVSLDDDAWFEDVDGLAKIFEYFDKSLKLGCLMFNLKEPGTQYISQSYNLPDGSITTDHKTCGCAYSKKALNDIGQFCGFFHSGAEETDITLKLIKRKYEIRFAEKIKIFHNYKANTRNEKWYLKVRFNTLKNDLLIVLLRFPIIYIIPYFFGKYFSHLRYNITNKRSILKLTLYSLLAPFKAIQQYILHLNSIDRLTINQFKFWLKYRW